MSSLRPITRSHKSKETRNPGPIDPRKADREAWIAEKRGLPPLQSPKIRRESSTTEEPHTPTTSLTPSFSTEEYHDPPTDQQYQPLPEHTPRPSYTRSDPQMTSTSRTVMMSQDDILTLINAIRATDPPVVERDNSKDLKFTEQAPFTGKPEELLPMLREAELRFEVQPRVYHNPTIKAYYILSLFKNGTAAAWKNQYIQQRTNKTLCEGNIYENFRTTLIENFRDVSSQDNAILKLQQISQGRRSVDTYNTEFKLLVHKAELDAQDNAALLIQLYI